MIIFLNRLPVPNLKHYCIVSLSCFVFVTLYAQKIFHDLAVNTYSSEKFDAEFIAQNGYFYTTYKTIINEPWCVWVFQFLFLID